VGFLLGARSDTAVGAPRLLLIKARIDDHHGEASAPAQGTMYLGAVARACGWDVRCVDTYLVEDDERAVVDALQEFPAEVIGLSALTAESRSLHRLAKVAREAMPNAVILAGGAHASAEPEKTAADPAFDAAVIGEGERTLQDILQRIAAGAEWRDVPGLARRIADGTVRRTPARPYIEDLDELPMPAWDLTDVDAYAKRRGMSLAGLRRYMPITTSRGCPYRCTYCHDIQGKRFRSHSPAYVLRIVDDLREKLDIHDFDITDDIFNFDADRMGEICDGFIQRGGIGFTCPNGVRADRMQVEQVDKMARAGLQYAAVAIETATPRLQKQIKKHLRFDKVQPILTAFADRNVFTSGFFMVGFPSETEAELKATIDFALESKLHAAYFFVVTPFGGTEMHEQVVDTMSSAATQLTGSGMYFRPVHNLSQVPDARFYRMRRNAYLRFYLDPQRIWRIWRAHPRRGNLLQYAATMFVRDAMRFDPGRLLGRFSRVQRKAPAARPPRLRVLS
jgi:anaerobic magnesium-protoporphyrin IX monomethyl ester cyclase